MFETCKNKWLNICEEGGSVNSKWGYINRVLSDLCYTISTDRRRDERGPLTSHYKFQHLSSVTEIIQYKINKGFELFDDEKMFKATDKHICSHLFTSKPKEIPVKTEDEKEIPASNDISYYLDLGVARDNEQ